MKKNIHPQYYPEATIKCACGNLIKVGSTKEKMEIEVCSACHPLYTGKKKVLDTTGMVDKFQKRIEKAATLKKQKEDSLARKKQREKKKNAPQKVISKKKRKPVTKRKEEK